jgi:arylsulfatase A-like enzyme
VNLLPYLNGEKSEEPHPHLFWRADHIWAVRDGDYKLILSVRDGWTELYDLKKDKSEKYDLKQQMPALYKKLYDLHYQWQQNNLPDKPLWPRLMDHKFHLDGVDYLFPA